MNRLEQIETEVREVPDLWIATTAASDIQWLIARVRELEAKVVRKDLACGASNALAIAQIGWKEKLDTAKERARRLEVVLRDLCKTLDERFGKVECDGEGCATLTTSQDYAAIELSCERAEQMLEEK